MNANLIDKVLALTRELKYVDQGKNKHFSFLVDKTHIVSIGWNSQHKTHPLSHKYKYRFNAIHSELSCIVRYKKNPKNLRLINTRINRLGQIGFSKPCKNCRAWLSTMNLRDIYYTDLDGNFTKLKQQELYI